MAGEILEEWKGKGRTCLIRGVTGSGKTQVYLKLLEEVLKKGQQAIVLIPEIALTYQTVMRFCRRFGSQVSDNPFPDGIPGGEVQSVRAAKKDR